MKPDRKYTPINCSYYDLLEADAALRKVSTIRCKYHNIETIVRGIIVDFFIRSGAEFLKLEDGTEIRLDEISEFNGKPLPKIF